MNMHAKSEYVASYTANTVPLADDDQIVATALAVLAKRVNKGQTISSVADTRNYFQLKYHAHEHEIFGVLFLDSRNRILSCEEIFTGTLNGTAVYPREIIKRALAVNAASVILFHNHPSGVPEPSRADELLTAKLKEALGFVEVRVLDHLVIGTEGVVSFSERGLL